MMIGDFLFLSGLCCLFFLVWIIIILLVKRIWKTYLGVFIGLSIAAAGAFTIVGYSTKLYIITEKNELESYHAFGTFSMKGKFGIPVDCRISETKTGVISYSKDTLLIKELIFQSSPSSPPPIGDKFTIRPGTFYEIPLKMGMIDYAFDEKIPEKIETSEIYQTSLYSITVLHYAH